MKKWKKLWIFGAAAVLSLALGTAVFASDSWKTAHRNSVAYSNMYHDEADHNTVHYSSAHRSVGHHNSADHDTVYHNSVHHGGAYHE